jgi:MFS family permease
MALYGVIVLIAVPETRPARPPRDERRPVTRHWFTDAQFLVLLVLMFALTVLPVMSGAPLAAHMDAQDFTTAGYGFVMAVNGIIIILLQPLLTAAAARFDPARVLAVGALCYGVGVALHGAGAHLLVHVGAVAVWTLGEILESPVRSTIVASLAPADARGRYQGAMAMAWGAAMWAGPMLGTAVWFDYGPAALWLGCLAVGVACALGVLAWAPSYRRRITSRSPSESS